MKRLEKQTASIKAQQVAQLEWMAEEAAIQWGRSIEDAETLKTTTTTGDPDSEGNAAIPSVKTDATIKGQTGNPALLREARESLAEIRSILGIDTKLNLEQARFDHQTKPPERTDDDYEFDLSIRDEAANPP